MRVLFYTVFAVAVIACIAFIVWPAESTAPAPTPPPSIAAPEPPQPETPPAPVAEPAPAPVAAAPEPEPVVAPHSPVSEPAPLEPLNAETLKNTGWERDGVQVTFAPDGTATVGRNRAKWQVEGGQVKLYSDTSDEVHYLEIRGQKLYWNGMEVAKAQ